MKMRPASSAGRATSRKTAAGAHSSTTSATPASSPSGSTGTGRLKPAMRASALLRSRAETAVKRKPSMPASSRRATAAPMAPKPPIATPRGAEESSRDAAVVMAVTPAQLSVAILRGAERHSKDRVVLCRMVLERFEGGVLQWPPRRRDDHRKGGA